MAQLPREVVAFFLQQHFVIVTTIDRQGRLHNSCKGIVDIAPDGKVYLLDLYMKNTFNNLKARPDISVTAVEEHEFRGYSIKGRGSIVKRDDLSPKIISKWDELLTQRISQRIIKNIHNGKAQKQHPEALLPKPAYMVLVKVEEVVDLSPQHIKKGSRNGQYLNRKRDSGIRYSD
ncbi:MAG: pyridoxamine 5'-phosphate oxidase family protein [Candidatus Omnitrophota bacterium]|nr:pyridoxamine 5'-phosphate oxidase family protein [Candidatus Omnitrophota bacterium]MBU1929697.1 pyridoxamine 5'-phosphate oxidase family protein [Candidatus Omnitrophota bacterium]MBU2035095.1 pyridoxamine 5'-phosphate oxidase family protein [Candidatus Omnitrophota bacterium]MBU2221224.1 pyridoxamine 5'-phosphate oxidase family protein [Candidatus Omnitrophota bacterium]MBU2257986.1 pyridoxamine 5'-phosphate oxidase family protein [Candidatus Omnitrophota bacterium]